MELTINSIDYITRQVKFLSKYVYHQNYKSCRFDTLSYPLLIGVTNIKDSYK